MIYNLSNQLDKESFKARCNNLFLKGGYVELTDKKPRTMKQNSYLHLIISYLGCKTGHSLEYVKEVFYKAECNSDLFLSEKFDPILKRAVPILRSSKELTTEEMTLSIERFRNWSSQEACVFLPDAINKDMLMDMEREVSRHKEYLLWKNYLKKKK
jgi:hypothetical protein